MLEVFPNISDPFANTGYVLEKNAISLLLGVADVDEAKIPGTTPFNFFSFFDKYSINASKLFSAQHMPTVTPSSRSSKSLKLMKELSPSSRTHIKALFMDVPFTASSPDKDAINNVADKLVVLCNTAPVFLATFHDELEEEWSAQLAAFHGSKSIAFILFPSSSAAMYTRNGFESPDR